MERTNPSSVFLQACRRQPVSHIPVWFMRQAGRYMKEYRDLRSKVSFLDLCKRPELACEVTLHAAKTLQTDAAILFSDILLFSEPLGFQLTFEEHQGPIIHNPFRGPKDLHRLSLAHPSSSLPFVMEAIKLIRKELPKEISLIGFAGAPFTVASYLIEGGKSKHFVHTKNLMHSDPKTWEQFISRISQETVEYGLAQIQAGAQAFQIFDSWVGELSPFQFKTFVLPSLLSLFQKLRSKISPEIPLIYFCSNSSHLLPLFKEIPATVFSLDHHVDLSHVHKTLGAVALQGNLDPALLLSSRAVIQKETQRILTSMSLQNGFIFNLGHGIFPQTPVENVRYVVDLVHEFSTS